MNDGNANYDDNDDHHHHLAVAGSLITTPPTNNVNFVDVERQLNSVVYI